MGEYQVKLDGNFEAFLVYFFEDDPNTTHRFDFSVVNGRPSYLRYDTINGQEYLTRRIEFFLYSGWQSDATGLTSGTITQVNFLYGDDDTNASGNIKSVTYDAATIDGLIKAAYGNSDPALDALAYALGADVKTIYGTGGDDVVVITDTTAVGRIELLGGDDTVLAGVQKTSPIIFNGGAGTDTFVLFDYQPGPGTNILDLRGGGGNRFIDRWGVAHSIKADFEFFEGSTGDDIFYLGPIGTLTDGGGGNDTFHDSALDELITGGDGHDTIFSSIGADTLVGGDGDDVIEVDGDGATVDAGKGDDSVTVRGSGAVVTTTFGKDFVVIQGNGANVLTGQDADTVEVRAGGVTLDTGPGVDIVKVGLVQGAAGSYDGGYLKNTLVVGDAPVAALGTSGHVIDLPAQTFTDSWGVIHGIQNFGHIVLSALDDTLHLLNQNTSYSTAKGGNYTIYGSSSDENITGGAGDDTLLSSAGRDHLYGFGGNDRLRLTVEGTMSGGPGDDILIVGDDPNRVLTDIRATGGSGSDTFIMRGVGVIDLTDLAVAGGVGARIDFATGKITMNGDVDVMIDPYSVLATSGADTISGSTGQGVIYAVAGDVFGGAGDDRFIGGDGYDRFYGGSGNDTFFSSAGRDYFDGGAGLDTFVIQDLGGTYDLRGGENSDLYLTDTLDLTIVDTGLTGYDKVQLTAAYVHDPALAPTRFLWIERLNGSSGDDVIKIETMHTTLLDAGAGDDVIEAIKAGPNGIALLGGDGNDRLSILTETGGDTLNGGTGADTMDGFDGSDVYFIDDALDVVTDTGTAGFDRAVVTSTAGISLDLTAWSGVERLVGLTGDDTLDASGYGQAITLAGGDGADSRTLSDFGGQVFGGNGADLITGGARSDALIGGAGADTISGGTGGSDFMLGGADADVFRIDAGAISTVVKDFARGTDMIDVATWGTSFANLIVTQNGADARVVSTDGGGVIWLANTLAGDLQDGDFLFV